MNQVKTTTKRCKVGDLVYCHSFGVRHDPYGNRGRVGQIVGPARSSHYDWSVLIPGKHSGFRDGFRDGTWAALDSWLTPIRGDEEPDAAPAETPKEEVAA